MQEKFTVVVIREAKFFLIFLQVSFKASFRSYQEVYLYEVLLQNFFGLIVTLLYFVKMKITQLLNMFKFEAVSLSF